MPSPTSNNTSPARLDPAQEFLERERASLEAINAIGEHASPYGSRSSGGSQEAISRDVAGLAIHSSQHSSLADSPMAEPDDLVDENGDHVMGGASPMAHMAMDHTLRRESEKIEYDQCR